ncbi:hypothetical protein [Prevotella sp. HUN102]|uniref:hypothetical protein n=1 Tax=Prevotella sp. HUN102 TaxID=1392486 RepID=UPI00048BDB55|nr:hypothetical protein [Prevotella sp. HUN102]
MKKKSKVQKIYLSPKIGIYQVTNNGYLLTASIEGRHNPAEPGGSSGDAKQGFLEDEWEEESEHDKSIL